VPTGGASQRSREERQQKPADSSISLVLPAKMAQALAARQVHPCKDVAQSAIEAPPAGQLHGVQRFRASKKKLADIIVCT